MLFERSEGHDAAVPRHENGYVEPLHAVYKKEPMFRAVKSSLEAGESKISAPLKKLKDVVYVSDDIIRTVSPGLETFLNVNSVEDMEKISAKNG